MFASFGDIYIVCTGIVEKVVGNADRNKLLEALKLINGMWRFLSERNQIMLFNTLCLW